MVANNTSTCKMNFSAILMASRYCPLLTCRNISDIHAALDSSNADKTLGMGLINSESKAKGKHSRPDTVDLLFHSDLFLFECRCCLLALLIRVQRFADLHTLACEIH